MRVLGSTCKGVLIVYIEAKNFHNEEVVLAV